MAQKMIFSGDESREFWGAINAVKDEEIHGALYAIGCKLQEFESLVRNLQKAVAKIMPDK